MEVIDGKHRTKYLKNKAGKDLRNPSLISLSYQKGKWKSREECPERMLPTSERLNQDGKSLLPAGWVNFLCIASPHQ